MKTSKIITHFLGIALFFLFSTLQVQAAATPVLQNLNQAQVDAVFKTFGSGLSFKPVEPAGSYGKLFGFAIGAIVGATSGSPIEDQIPGVSVPVVPNADIFLGLQGPLGLALELGFLPSLDISGASLDKFGLNLKWTFTDVFTGILPLDLAARLYLGSSDLSYTYTSGALTDTASFESSQWGFNVSASKKLSVLEPYVGLGYFHQTATLSNRGVITLYNTTVSTSQSFENGYSSLWFYAGLQLKLLVLTLGAQYDNIYGNSFASLKVGFKF